MSDQAIREICDRVLNSSSITLENIPQLDLYMDQVLTLLNQQSVQAIEKRLTKSMINNYSKEGLIEPVKGKKYSTDQVLQIFLVCAMKPALSMNRIKIVMNALKEEKVDWRELYRSYLDIQNEHTSGLAKMLGDTLPEKNLSVVETSLFVLLLCTAATYLTQIAENIVELQLTEPTGKTK